MSCERGTPVQLFVGFLLPNFGQIIRAEIDELLESSAFDFPENHLEADLGCPVARNPAVGKNLATAMPPVGPLGSFWKKERLLRGGWPERLSEAGAQGVKARYRGTSLIRKRHPPGPYSRHMRRALLLS